MQIAPQEPPGEAVVSAPGVAFHRPACEDDERVAQDENDQGREAQRDEEGPVIVESAGLVGPVEVLVFLNNRRVRSDGEEGHDGGHARDLQARHHQNSHEEEVQVAPLPPGQKGEQLSEDVHRAKAIVREDLRQSLRRYRGTGIGTPSAAQRSCDPASPSQALCAPPHPGYSSIHCGVASSLKARPERRVRRVRRTRWSAAVPSRFKICPTSAGRQLIGGRGYP